MYYDYNKKWCFNYMKQYNIKNFPGIALKLSGNILALC